MAIKVLGVNADHDTCNRCGKTNLKKVVWVEINDGEPEPIGCECAARLLGRTGRKVWQMAEEKARVHRIGESRSVVDFFVSKVSSDGVARVLCRANGSRKEIEQWAEQKFGVSVLAGLHVDAPVAMSCYSKVEW